MHRLLSSTAWSCLPLLALSALIACSSEADTDANEGGHATTSSSVASTSTSAGTGGQGGGQGGEGGGAQGGAGGMTQGSGGSATGGSGGVTGTSSTSSSSATSTTSTASTTSTGAGGGGTLTPGTSTRTYPVAGQSRSVIVVVPQAAGSQKVPLVIALHGNGDTASNFIQTSGLAGLADSRGFIVAAPQGITQTITVGGQTVPNVAWDAYRATVDGNIDLPLLDAIRTDLVESGSVDTQRIFPYGYSQGGYMSFRSAMESAAVLSCGAVLAAADPFGGSGGLLQKAARKIPVSLQIGTKDWAIDLARSTRDALQQSGFPVDYHEIQGAGHVPLPGDATVPLDYCLSQAL